MPPESSTARRQAFVEIALIFAVFCILGGWPVPDVNEPHYLGKAIHYWNPDWLAGDFFMSSADTHKVFYIAFGWLSLWLGPVALVWTGRAVTWLLLAWAWRRLSFAIVPRPWYSVLTGALFACLMERCHMAGEWVIGGVEAKGFAFVFVLLGIESIVRNRWNRALVMLGAASAFHVLVGGWAAVATGFAWLWLRLRERSRRRTTSQGGSAMALSDGTPPLVTLWPGIVCGILLALPGVWPSLWLNQGVDPQTVHLAHQIYVFERLPHHLLLGGIRSDLIVRFVLLTAVWLAFVWVGARFVRGIPAGNDGAELDETSQRLRRLRAFVGGALIITLVGVAIQPVIWLDRALAANLLRYYWFRLTDVAVPLGVALEGAALIQGLKSPRTRPWSRALLAFAVLIVAFHVGDRAIDRIAPATPRSNKLHDYNAWRSACGWIAESGEIPADARFLVPRLAQTFGWYANRSAVVDWKDVPQDAENVVEWWKRVRDIYERPNTGPKSAPQERWRDSLAELDAGQLRELGSKYDAGYAIMERTEPLLPFDAVYKNRVYVVYRIGKDVRD